MKKASVQVKRMSAAGHADKDFYENGSRAVARTSPADLMDNAGPGEYNTTTHNAWKEKVST